jgi:hypothetical protein
VIRIFDLLFPTEIYNPYSSDGRVHNLVAYARESLKGMNLPVEIQSTQSGYRLRPSEDVSFVISRQMIFADQSHVENQSLTVTGSGKATRYKAA